MLLYTTGARTSLRFGLYVLNKFMIAGSRRTRSDAIVEHIAVPSGMALRVNVAE
jgi:hypothetical protein